DAVAFLAALGEAGGLGGGGRVEPDLGDRLLEPLAVGLVVLHRVLVALDREALGRLGGVLEWGVGAGVGLRALPGLGDLVGRCLDRLGLDRCLDLGRTGLL